MSRIDIISHVYSIDFMGVKYSFCVGLYNDLKLMYSL